MFKLTPQPSRLNFPEPNRIEAVPYDFKTTKKTLAVWDTETDPFEYGRAVLPFTNCFVTRLENGHPDCGLFDYYDDERDLYVKEFWGLDNIEQFFLWVEELEGEYLVYVHNGGNFDFYFCLDFVDRGTAPFIINGRLARLYMCGQEFRDSYSLIPVALDTATKGAKNKKTKIDYDLFNEWPCSRIDTREETTVRDIYRDIIASYQRDDCFALFDLVSEAHAMFGDRLTMASIALPMLRSFHGFENMAERTDESLRPYYFGGRCQCFEIGELKDEWTIYDVNSMYPFVMANCNHPISSTPHYETNITERTHFAFIRAWSDGALPIRDANGGLAFPKGYGDFYASIHEINAGLDTGTLRISKVYQSIYFDETTNFQEFVDHFYSMRLKADADGDELRKLFYKLVLNSSYGKLAQDPRKYENFLFDPDDIPTPLRCGVCDIQTPVVDRCETCRQKLTSPSGWYPHTDRGSEIIYARPSIQSHRRGFYNVATAASITGAARAYLLRGLAASERPIYCDTDSIICRHLHADTDRTRLGAWKVEATGDTAAIGGKKLYAVFNAGEPIKSASKGVKLTPHEILRVCAGDTVDYCHPVPKFKLNGDIEFTQRSIKATGVL